MDCPICNKSFANELETRKHLHKSHGFSNEQSFLLFHKDIKPNICPNCGKVTHFLKNSYTKFCSKDCIHKYNANNKAVKEKRKQTNLEKYGVEYASQSKPVKQKKQNTSLKRYGDKNFTNRDKAKETMISKYGVNHYNQTEESKEKHKKTNLEKYGVENPFQDKSIQNKILNKKIQKYGSIHNIVMKACDTKESKYGTRNCIQNIKKAILDKYEVEHYSKTQDFLTKIQNTNLEKYGSQYYFNTEKFKNQYKEFCLDNFGVEHYSKTQEFKDKVKKTSNQRFNSNHYLQSQQYKDLYKNPDFVKSWKDKQYETKKVNNSFKTSKTEDLIYNIIKEVFPNVIRQHKSDLFPFASDFYIPEIDLYIDYNGTWTHGKHSFNIDNPEDLKTLSEWKNKQTEYYNNAIYTWTILDPKKREIARQNKIFRLEFWNIGEIKEWLKNHKTL